MNKQNNTPKAGGPAEVAEDTKLPRDFCAQDNSALIDAAARSSRYHCSVLVADRARFKELGKALNNEDACRAVALATRLDAKFVVLAGRLDRHNAGCFGVAVLDPALLESSVVSAYNRLTAAGETNSLWLVAVDGETRERVNAVLAELSATEGAA